MPVFFSVKEVHARGVFVCLILLCFMICFLPSFGAAEDLLEEYPDGSYGLNLGYGYEVDPQGNFLLPAEYRDEYQDTPYGPRTGDSFVVFPDFKLKKEDKKKTEEEEKETRKALIFYPDTAGHSPGNTWGVSGSASDSKAAEQEQVQSPDGESGETQRSGWPSVKSAIWGFSGDGGDTD